MVPIVGMLVSITSVQAKLVLSHRPMFLACCPVHIVAREGVHCGTVQYWLARLTPAPTSRWIAGRSTPGGRSMCTSHWSMHRTRMFGRLVPWLFTAAPYCWSALLHYCSTLCCTCSMLLSMSVLALSVGDSARRAPASPRSGGGSSLRRRVLLVGALSRCSGAHLPWHPGTFLTRQARAFLARNIGGTGDEEGETVLPAHQLGCGDEHHYPEDVEQRDQHQHPRVIEVLLGHDHRGRGVALSGRQAADLLQVAVSIAHGPTQEQRQQQHHHPHPDGFPHLHIAHRG